MILTSIISTSKPAAAGLQSLVLAGLMLVGGCKEDLDEARAALAVAQKDYAALTARVAVLENELAAARTELAHQKKASAPAPAHPPALTGETGAAERGERAAPSPRAPLAAGDHVRPKT